MKTTYDLTIKSNRTDYKIKPRICHGTFLVNGTQAIFELEESRNWFARHHFVLNEGYTVIPEGSDQAYTITGIDFPDKAAFSPYSHSRTSASRATACTPQTRLACSQAQKTTTVCRRERGNR